MSGLHLSDEKADAFARAYMDCKRNASEAYRMVANVGENTKPETIWSAASTHLSHPKVVERLQKLEAELRERTMVTVESITEELDEAKRLASNEKQAAAMTSAIMGKAKVNGLLVEKVDNTHTVADPLAQLFAEIAGAGKRIGDR